MKHEWIGITDRTAYIKGPTRIGIFCTGEADAYVIDTGCDDECAAFILDSLRARGLTLRAIINTHSHADHNGGNRYLQERTGCRIFAAGTEAAITRHTRINTSLLFGGNPYRELYSKLLFAAPSDDVTEIGFPVTHPEFPQELEIIPLPGHAPDMIGLRTPDGVLFTADTVSSARAIDRLHIVFLYDVRRHLETLDRLEVMQASLFVPSHSDPVTDIGELVRINREQIFRIRDRLLETLRVPDSFDGILEKLCDGFGMELNHELYALVGSTVRSYLAWLRDCGEVLPEFCGNRLLWKRTSD